MVIYPQNADASEQARAHISALEPARFQAVEDYMTEQAARYEPAIEIPFSLALADPIAGAPTAPDYQSFWSRALWGLRLRFRYRTFEDQARAPEIVVIVRFQRREVPARSSFPCNSAILGRKVLNNCPFPNDPGLDREAGLDMSRLNRRRLHGFPPTACRTCARSSASAIKSAIR